jgi:hypothetical protein
MLIQHILKTYRAYPKSIDLNYIDLQFVFHLMALSLHTYTAKRCF